MIFSRHVMECTLTQARGDWRVFPRTRQGPHQGTGLSLKVRMSKPLLKCWFSSLIARQHRENGIHEHPAFDQHALPNQHLNTSEFVPSPPVFPPTISFRSFFTSPPDPLSPSNLTLRRKWQHPR